MTQAAGLHRTPPTPSAPLSAPLSPRFRPRIAGLLLGLALCVGLGLAMPAAARRDPARADASAPNPDDLRELRGRIDALKDDIAGKEEIRNEARDALRESERAISEANRKLRDLAAQQQAGHAELDRMAAEERRIQADLATRQDAVGRILMARYYGGELDYLKLLLSGEDPDQTARNLHYYSYISRAQAGAVRELQASLERLRDLEGRSRDKTSELADIQAAQKKERDDLAARQASRRKALNKVATDIRNRQSQVKNLERDENRLTRLIEGLGKVISSRATPGAPANSKAARAGGEPTGTKIPESAVVSRGADSAGTAFPAFVRLKGSLHLPVKGELASRFGSPRSDGGPSWKGLFIRTAAGQEVRAVAAGRVVFADWMRGFGNLLILDHGQGYLSIYGNNEAVLKQLGDMVRVGDAVATTGASGGGTDSGLYFELRHEGQAFDPMKWVTLK
jgi:septal ring factor EnvC (AmiA/AmiB activator)